MDRKDIKMFLLHCENMYILKMLGADDEFIKRLEQRWKDNEEDIELDCSHKEESQKPKRTLEELGITEDKYYIVGRKNH